MKKVTGVWNIGEILIRLFYCGFLVFALMLSGLSLYSLFFEKPYRGTALAWILFIILFIIVILIPFAAEKENKKKNWIFYPSCLLLVSLLLSLMIVFLMGQNPSPVSDPKTAWESSFMSSSELGYYSQTFTGWFFYSRLLRATHLISVDMMTPIVLNALMHSMTVVFLYYIVFLYSKDSRFALLTGCLYMIWPSHLFYIVVYTPEYANIFFSVLSLLLIVIACQSLKKNKRACGYTCCGLAGLSASLANAFKTIGIIYVFALFIVFIGSHSQKMVTTLKAIGVKKSVQKIKSKAVLLLIIPIISYIAFSQLLFLCMDLSMGTRVNRSTTSYHISTGLNAETKGAYSSDMAQKYKDYVLANSNDYSAADKLMWDDLFNDKENLEQLNLRFFGEKFAQVWRSIGYLFLSNINMQAEDENTQIFNRDYWLSGVYPIAQMYYVVITLGILAGAIFAFLKKEHVLVLYSCLVLFGFALVLLVSEVQSRYKCVVFPYMAIIAGYGLYSCLTAIKSKTQRKPSS